MAVKKPGKGQKELGGVPRIAGLGCGKDATTKDGGIPRLAGLGCGKAPTTKKQ